MQIDITASGGSFENVGDSTPVLLSLLADVERLTVEMCFSMRSANSSEMRTLLPARSATPI